MKIVDFADLVRVMPVERQSSEVLMSWWLPFFRDHWKLAEIFGDEESIMISRADVFAAYNQGDLEILLFMALLWAYPFGMRGRNHERILRHKHAVIAYLKEAIEGIHLWDDYWRAARQVSGLGVSVISKLLYFCGASVEGLPATILDKNTLTVIGQGKFEDFKGLSGITYYTALKLYPEYLERIHDVSHAMDVDPAKVEMFLVEFGRQLK